MEFTVLDKSKYLKGLLIVSKKDQTLTQQERELISEAGNRFGFAKEFYEEALNNLLRNQHIKDEPIIFSDQSIARLFIQDGLKLSFIDAENPVEELDWLKGIALANELGEEWFYNSLKTFKDSLESIN